MSTAVTIICPLCYSPDLDMYMEGMSGSIAGAMTMPAGNIASNNMELKCKACGHVFKPADGKLSQQTGTVAASAPVQPAAAVNRDYVLMLSTTQGKLVAVKYCCDTYGMGLKEAKDYVDSLADSKSYDNLQYRTGSAPDDAQVQLILQQQGLLHAVKFVKESTGWSLKASKDYVDQLAGKRGIQVKKEGCFVATACYGDYDAPEVKILRRYRDEVLARNSAGRAFIRAYYFLSPSLARFIAARPGLQSGLRQRLLAPLVRRLNRQR